MGDFPNDIREIQSVGAGTHELFAAPELTPALRRHGVRLAGLSWTSREFCFVRRRPSMAQYLVGLRGTGRVWLDGGWQPCGAGQAYVTPVGKFHAYEARRNWVVGWVMFEPGAALAKLDGPVRREADAAAFERILLGLHEEGLRGANSPALVHWTELLIHQCAQLAGTMQPARLWKLWQAVQRDFAFPWTLDALARAAGVGAETLRQLAQRETGRSPLAQVRHLRMQHAAALLGTGQKVEFVARLVGYENSFAFSTAFKRTLGRAPSAYQRKS